MCIDSNLEIILLSHLIPVITSQFLQDKFIYISVTHSTLYPTPGTCLLSLTLSSSQNQLCGLLRPPFLVLQPWCFLCQGLFPWNSVNNFFLCLLLAFCLSLAPPYCGSQSSLIWSSCSKCRCMLCLSPPIFVLRCEPLSDKGLRIFASVTWCAWCMRGRPRKYPSVN